MQQIKSGLGLSGDIRDETMGDQTFRSNLQRFAAEVDEQTDRL